ncbi:MAG: UbiD family decarboxylase, partial [Dehalococcoidales bacterium]|nr:UbiD family decarboxylase [Dehalococcoidales bacterium]
MFSDMREYIKQVEKLEEIKIIQGADWDLEIGTITEIMAKPGAPLLLFDNIKGYPSGYRVVTNLAASHQRVCLLLGIQGEESPLGLVKAWREKTKQGFKPIPPVEVKTGPVKENIFRGNDIDLF